MAGTKAYAAQSSDSPVALWNLQRRDPRAHDVEIEILFCGVCHSDLHRVRNEWGGTLYPCVPGHEIVGRVTAVGGSVSRFKPGDVTGVGVLIDTCRQCSNCREDFGPYCEVGATETYNSPDKHTGGHTFG